MLLRPPRATRTDTLFPYTTLFRSTAAKHRALRQSAIHAKVSRMSWSKHTPRPSNTPIAARGVSVDASAAMTMWAKMFQKRLVRMPARSEEHTSELQSLMRISYAVLCLEKKNTTESHIRQAQH